jgi:NCS2 family nucleobase:cation symporter-2
VTISIGIGMIALIAPNFKQWMSHNLHPLIESGTLLASASAAVLNLRFNCAQDFAATMTFFKHSVSLSP